MTFNDIFKSNFLENITGVSIFDTFTAFILAFCLGLFIFFVYKKTFPESCILPVLRLRLWL